MGMYTELRFKAYLKKDTPDKIVKVIKWLIDYKKDDYKVELLDHEFFKSERFSFTLTGASYDTKYPILTKEDRGYKLNTLSEIKNYCSSLDKFCDWIKPYIAQGLLEEDAYAYTHYEETCCPTYHFLDKDSRRLCDCEEDWYR